MVTTTTPRICGDFFSSTRSNLVQKIRLVANLFVDPTGSRTSCSVKWSTPTNQAVRVLRHGETPVSPTPFPFKSGTKNSPCGEFICGPDRIRTGDLLIANEALYQLSYGPPENYPLDKFRVGVEGIGPSTSVLSGQRSTTELHARVRSKINTYVYFLRTMGGAPLAPTPEQTLILRVTDVGASSHYKPE